MVGCQALVQLGAIKEVRLTEEQTKEEEIEKICVSTGLNTQHLLAIIGETHILIPFIIL